MGKIHKSLRIEETIAAAVSSLATEGETEAATYNRVLAAGVEALERGVVEEPESSAQGAGEEGALVDALKAHVETLKADNERLGRQLEVKDKQIEALAFLTGQAQQTASRALEAPAQAQEQASEADGEKIAEEPKERRGFWARLFG